MKTKLILLIALGTSAYPLAAATPGIPQKKIPLPASQSLRPSAPMLKPSARPAASSYLPAAKLPVAKAPLNLSKRPMPALIRPVSLPKIKPSVSSAIKGRQNLTGSRSVVKTPIPARISGLGNGRGESLREGRELAGGLKDMKDLRNSGIRDTLPGGLRDTFGNGNQGSNHGPVDPATGAQNYNRTPGGPDYTGANGNGLTDVRGSASNGRKGYGNRGGNPRESSTTIDSFSSRGRSIFDQGGSPSSVARYSYPDGSYDIHGYSQGDSTGEGRTVTEHHDGHDRVTGFTVETYERSGRNSVHRGVHLDSAGAVQDVVIVNTNDRTGTQTKDVYGPDGNRQSHTSSRDVPTPRPTTETDGNGTKTCDRGNGDISMGGPVGPGVGAVTGLQSIDLLRQHAETEQSGNQGGLFTAGQIQGGRQVRPDSNSSSHANRNPLPVNPFSTITNPAPVGGEGATGSGDRPD